MRSMRPLRVGSSRVWSGRSVCSLLGGLLLSGLAAGCGTPSFVVTPIANAGSLGETTVVGGSGLFPDKIALIGVEGTLADVNVGGLLTPTNNVLSEFVQELNKAAADDRVKAVVLRVNSPGGTVSTSDAMYQLLTRFKQQTHKPVIASVGEIGASGAYYVSCGADKIVAQPTSLVGSIGVIFETFDLQGTMMKLGIRPGNYKSAAHKDIDSPFRDATPEEQTIMQNLVDSYFARFKGIVTTNRTIDPANLTMLTDGRVFSGEQGQALGLVDQVGLLDDAITLAKNLSHASGAEVVQYKRPYNMGGSIYALNSTPTPQASSTLQLQLPGATAMLPAGFYYLWQP